MRIKKDDIKSISPDVENFKIDIVLKNGQKGFLIVRSHDFFTEYDKLKLYVYDQKYRELHREIFKKNKKIKCLQTGEIKTAIEFAKKFNVSANAFRKAINRNNKYRKLTFVYLNENNGHNI